MLLIYDDDDYSQGYGQVEEAFRALTKDDNLKLYISDQAFRSTNVNAAGEATNNRGYNLYVFNIRYQKNLETAQPIKVELKFSEDVPAGIYGYVLVLTNKAVCFSSDGERLFDKF